MSDNLLNSEYKYVIHTKEEINNMKQPEYLLKYDIPENYYSEFKNGVMFFNPKRQYKNIPNNIFQIVQSFYAYEEVNSILIIDSKDVNYAYKHFRILSFFFEEMNLYIAINCYHSLNELLELRKLINRDFEVLSDNYNPLLNPTGFDAMFYKGIKFI